jgi:hypothetical protein
MMCGLLYFSGGVAPGGHPACGPRVSPWEVRGLGGWDFGGSPLIPGWWGHEHE